jgi:hypothetical protein
MITLLSHNNHNFNHNVILQLILKIVCLMFVQNGQTYVARLINIKMEEWWYETTFWWCR